jgi:hypothetical protein
MHNKNQQVMTEPAACLAIWQLLHQLLSVQLASLMMQTRMIMMKKKKLLFSSFYWWCVYFESEKAGSKDLSVLFAMTEGHNGLNFPKHTDPLFIESKIYVKKMKPNQQILQPSAVSPCSNWGGG